MNKTGVLLLAVLSASGCAARVDFTTAATADDGISGRSWHAPYFLDAGLFTPGPQTPAALLNSFDAATSGTSVQLAATWHEPGHSFYRGYAALYQDGIGWAGAGPGFGLVAIDAGNDLGEATIAGNSSGLFVAGFFAATTAGHSVSASYSSGLWQTYPTNTLVSAIPDWNAANDYTSGPRAVSALDSSGNGVAMLSAPTVAPHAQVGLWQSIFPQGLNPALQDLGAITAGSGLSARFDGSNQVCVTYELAGTPALTAKCVAVGGAYNFVAASTSTISTAAVAGHETATDGAGGIMTVFYQLNGANYQVYASLGTAGSWSATPTQIDGSMAAGYFAPSPATIPGARPGVAYVGNGQYLAVWVGVSAAATQLYSAIYTAGTGWGAATVIAGSYDPYWHFPHAQGLHAFGNGNGNAGFALNKIYTDQGIPSGLPLGSYPEAKKVRVVQVARWQKKQGWQAVSTFGNRCYEKTAASDVFPASVNTANAYCNRRPTGVILPSGSALVFFQDRDENATSGILGSPGNRRLAVTAFTP